MDLSKQRRIAMMKKNLLWKRKTPTSLVSWDVSDPVPLLSLIFISTIIHVKGIKSSKNIFEYLEENTK